MKNQKKRGWSRVCGWLGVLVLFSLLGLEAQRERSEGAVTESAGESVPQPVALAQVDLDASGSFTDTYPGKLAPFAGMLTAVVIVWLVMAMVKSSEKQRHESIRKYLDEGKEVPWELLVDEGNPQTWRPVSDLRKAFIWMAIGLGLGLTAYIFTGVPRALAVGLVFVFIGLGYLIVWFIEPTPVDPNDTKGRSA